MVMWCGVEGVGCKVQGAHRDVVDVAVTARSESHILHLQPYNLHPKLWGFGFRFLMVMRCRVEGAGFRP